MNPLLGSARTFLALLLFAAHGVAEPVRLASEGRARLPIVVGEKASASTKATAAELARYLGKISGAEFAVKTGGGGGIVGGAAADFAKLPFPAEFGSGPFEREDYVLRSQPGTLFELLDFAKMDGDGFFKIEVPPGADGALWKFEHSLGQRLLMTVPPYLARSGEALLLPREVVEADTPRQ